MINRNRREFLADVGRGMLLASVGPALATDLGLAPVFAGEEAGGLSFGKMEPLVALMQDTPADKLLPVLIDKMKDGTELGTLVSAGALANARTFGGEDYTGFHAFMALLPSYQMAQELPKDRQALPVLKVLYRNTSRIQQFGGRKKEVLHPVEAAELPKDRPGGEVLRDATRKPDVDAAERTFAALAKGPIGEAYNHLQFTVQDELDVHRVVLAWRAWAVLDLAGKEQAHTLLRQSVRFCCDEEKSRKGNTPEIRTVLPKLLDQYKLISKEIGKRKAEDAWIEGLAQTIFGTDRAKAADAVAAALAEGMSPEDVGEAISLAANRLVLCDPGLRKEQASPGKPEGSVHGASVGVHASDAANAWRNIARVSNARNTVASLIVGAYHTAGQSGSLNKEPYPLAEQRDKIKTKDADKLLAETEAAIKERNQAQAAALIHRYGELALPERPVFDLLLRYAVSEDGALHAEKYYRTVTEEFASMRPAFRWRELVGLARVTASESGFPAAGYAEACRLLKV
ncbi:MAG TPA: hypothetical protein VGG61_13055 [Gemmataceae bacterium]